MCSGTSAPVLQKPGGGRLLRNIGKLLPDYTMSSIRTKKSVNNIICKESHITVVLKSRGGGERKHRLLTVQLTCD